MLKDLVLIKICCNAVTIGLVTAQFEGNYFNLISEIQVPLTKIALYS